MQTQKANIFYMNKKFHGLIFLIIAVTVIFLSCRGRGQYATFPVSAAGTLQMDEPAAIGTADIIETKNGSPGNLPAWLRIYLEEGITGVENLDAYGGKYVFIFVNEGENFNALTKWAEYFRTAQDFAMLVSARIERRFYLTASLFPDDEYGEFFEAVIKNSNSTEYQGVVKDDTHWIKMKPQNENGQESSPVYMFFILTTIDKMNMQTFIRNMMTKTAAETTATSGQTAAINRLRQTFFEGF